MSGGGVDGQRFPFFVSNVVPETNAFGVYDVFARLRRTNPEAAILVSSGYSIEGEAQELLDDGARGFLQKPFDMAALSEVLRSSLPAETRGQE